MGEELNTSEHSGAGIAHFTSPTLAIYWIVTTRTSAGRRMCYRHATISARLC